MVVQTKLFSLAWGRGVSFNPPAFKKDLDFSANCVCVSKFVEIPHFYVNGPNLNICRLGHTLLLEIR